MPIRFLRAEGQYLVIRWLCKPKSYTFLEQCFDKCTLTFQNTHNHSSHSIFLQIYFSDFDYHFNKHNLRQSQRLIDPNLSMTNSMIDENQEIKKKLKFHLSNLCAAPRLASTIHTGLVFYRLPLRNNFKNGWQFIDQTKQTFPVKKINSIYVKQTIITKGKWHAILHT